MQLIKQLINILIISVIFYIILFSFFDNNNSMKSLILKLIKENQEYKIDLYARSIAYYMVASITSIIILSIEIINKYRNVLSSSILIKFISAFFDTFSDFINSLIISIKFNSFSFVLFFTVIYSAARIINGFNKFSFEIYKIKKFSNNFIGLLSSGLMFLLLLITILIEMIIIIFGKYIISYLISSIFIISIIEFLLEMIIFLVSISLLYLYVLPKKENRKLVFKGALFSTTSFSCPLKETKEL